jgi:hypothetical protein
VLNPLRQAGRYIWRGLLYVDGAYLRDHPELELFPDGARRRASLRRVALRSGLSWRFWAAAMIAGLGLVPVWYGLTDLVQRASGLTQRAVFWACGVPALVVAGMLGNWWLRRGVPRLLRQELLDAGVPVCMGCGYSLRASPGPRCPECGRPFDDRVRIIIAASEIAVDDGVAS